MMPAMIAAGPGAASAAVVERVAYHGWSDAYRLQNGTVELIVVPAVARILHFGYVGKANLLWENARIRGVPPQPGRWSNYGGDKVWIWPQNEWPARSGSGWPPATDSADLIVHEATVDGATLRLTSPPIPGFGVRTIREIRLAPNGTKVSLTNRIERLAIDADFRLAPWTVTQLPADGRLFARLLRDARLAGGYRVMDQAPFKQVTRAADRVLMIERPNDRRARMGLDGDVLAWQRGEDLLIVRSVDATPLSEFAPAERAQVYSHPDGDPDMPPGLSYIELELTAAPRTLKAGQSVTLETTWELVRLPAAEQAPQAIARKLRAEP